jgi:hypothetical protein
MPQTRPETNIDMVKLFAEPIGSATTLYVVYLPVPVVN